MIHQLTEIDKEIDSIDVEQQEEKEKKIQEKKGLEKHDSTHLAFDQTSDIDVEEVKDEVVEVEEAKELPPQEKPYIDELKSKLLEKPKQVIPDNKLLQDLMNMGFGKEESEAALIAVNNESIDLALDKVFEQKKVAEDHQETSLQNIIEKSLSNMSNPSVSQTTEQSNEAKQKEENAKKELEKQQKLEEQNKLKEEKTKQKEEVQQKLDTLEGQIKQIRNSKILGKYIIFLCYIFFRFFNDDII